MKFTTYEAEGIRPFVANSPLMSGEGKGGGGRKGEGEGGGGKRGGERGGRGGVEEGRVYGLISIPGFSAMLGVVKVTIALLIAARPFSPRVSALGLASRSGCSSRP